MPLPLTHLIDELATAYVQAVAAKAGAAIAVTRDYGVDGTLKHIVKTDEDGYVESGYPVDFQLKGTMQSTESGGLIKFDLKARNYNLLVSRPETATPYYLFLVCFKGQSDNWMSVDPEKLIVNASAFWWKYSGPRTSNTASVRIEIPAVNRLTWPTMEEMLRASKERFVNG
jgi:Domain of unknown function (DUF4365)